MVRKPFGQCININIWVFLSFLLASLKNLSKNKKVVPFPGKRAIIVTVYGVCVRQAHACCAHSVLVSYPRKHVQRLHWATTGTSILGADGYADCLALNKSLPFHNCALTSANTLVWHCF